MDLELEKKYLVSGLKAVRFNIVRKPSDIEDESESFSPVMCHQIFKENESIWGYSDLKIHICYTAASMHSFIDIKYSSAIEDKKHPKPDNIKELLKEWISTGCTYSKEEYLKILEKEDAGIMFGNTLDSIETEMKGQKRNFIINQCSLVEPGFEEFHHRLESWIVWFIDASSQIDLEDPRWLVFVIYEKVEDPNHGVKYYPVGYCTLYKYYAFPEHIRPRISQFIILPPFQNYGLGGFMLKTVYKFLWNMPEVRDITVEDPSEEFQKIRDYLDATAVCKELPAFSEESLLKGFNPTMPQEAQKRFKINGKQARRIYEILKLAKITKNGKGKDEYKEELLHRVKTPLRKHEAKMKRLSKVLQIAGMAEDIAVRGKHMEMMIDQLIESYGPVVEKLIKNKVV